ncbi:MAG: hypothetical protein KC964_23595 [Candidatus Omnitrophica bacterium]|nr:hypothetical protein [Candidatus Omnitrophota bacterium]
MSKLYCQVAFLFIAILSNDSMASTDPLFEVENQRWKPQPDEVYLQEVSEKITTDKPVESIAAIDGKCYAILAGKICSLEGNRLQEIPDSPEKVTKLETHLGALWAYGPDGVYRLKDKKWEEIKEGNFVDLCMHLGNLYAATASTVYRLEGEKLVDIEPERGYLSSDKTVVMADGTQILANPVRIGPVQRIGSYSGTLYVLRPGELVLFDGRIVNEYPIDWGMLPSPNTRDMLPMGSRLFISTDKGVAVVRGAAVTSLTGKEGLPYEDTTCLAEGFDDDLWIGTTTGAIRMLKDDWHYFGPYHWLPGNGVTDIAVDGKTVYIATKQGIGIIRYEPYTLLKKADYYERHIKDWGHQRLGFIHSLYWGGEDKGWIREISDNDGGHTAPYLAAMCFKYAVTGDDEARKEALDSFKAMIWLEQITGKEGFVARAIWSPEGDKDKMAEQGSGGLPAKWYPTEDGKWYWKGDTSSDEISAHFYSVSLFHDLVAQGAEKERAAEHLARIAKHIIDHGWLLEDMDGKPTRWGRWDPDYLYRPYGIYARGLNGMEAQTYAKTAWALTGDEIFKNGFQKLLDWGYQDYTVRQKITFPPEDIAPWDDNLAFWCYYTLIRYTDDPNLRSIYLRSLERTFEVMRMQHVSWYNFAYSAMTGNDGELDKAMDHLRSWTLDCTVDSYHNSHRADLAPEPGYVPYGGGTRGMSPRETSVKGGSRNALPYDGGDRGRKVAPPTGFIRDYWMGRFHGIVEPPATNEENLISVPAEENEGLGAPPYQGPERPDEALLPSDG